MSEQAVDAGDEPISIPLHQKHWVVVLAALEQVNELAAKKVEELKKQGIDHSTLPAPMVTALAAPLIVRGIIVKELTARGVMTPEANARLGIDRIMDAI